jgi:hypothetical protein
MNILYFNTAIYKILTDNEEIKKMVGNNIYPVVAPLNTKNPYVVYKRQISVQNDNKDSRYSMVSIEINVYSNNYQESIKVAELVKNTLENVYNKEVESFKIKYIVSTSIDEDYNEDYYSQTMYFDCKVLN